MKRIIAIGAILLVAISTLPSCGETYTCRRCEESTSKIYYDIDGDEAYCEDCAKDYWAPFDYEDYRA